jgi:hypothetical protein
MEDADREQRPNTWLHVVTQGNDIFRLFRNTRIEPSFNGRLRRANDRLGNTVFLCASGTAFCVLSEHVLQPKDVRNDKLSA